MYSTTQYYFQQTITSTPFQNSSQETYAIEQRIAERRVFLLVGKNELESFKKCFEAWDGIPKKIQQLIDIIEKLENLGQYGDSQYFTGELNKLNEALFQLDTLITRYSDYCRCFSLRDGDALLIFYRNQLTLQNPQDSPIEAVYIHNNKPYHLESKNLPKDLQAVRSPKHFFALLEHPYIRIQENSQNPSKITFSLEQTLPGGMFNPGNVGVGHIEKACTLVGAISQALSLSKKLLDATGLDLEAGPKPEGNSLKDVIGGGLIGGGGVALIMGSAVAVPAAVILTGFFLVLKGAGYKEKINRMEEILSVILRILEVLKAIPYLNEHVHRG